MPRSCRQRRPAPGPQRGRSEQLTYDADGSQVIRVVNDVQYGSVVLTTTCAGGLYESDTKAGTVQATRYLYQFHGQVVAQRTVGAGLTYLHGDTLAAW